MITCGGGPDRSSLRRLAQRRQQLLVDDLDDLLRRRQALHHLGADGALADARDELLDDLEVDVGFEQRQAHLAQRGIDVLLGQAAARGQLIEDRVQLGLQALEHAIVLAAWQYAHGPARRPAHEITAHSDC